MNIEYVCDQCGKAFSRQKGQVKGPLAFCGKPCYRGWSMSHPAPNRLLPPDEQIVAEYNAGNTYRELAERYHSTIPSIANVFRRLGLYADYRSRTPHGRSHHFYTDLPMEEVIRQYADGMSCDQLAELYHTTSQCILRKLKAAGVQRRPAGFGTTVICTDGHVVRSTLEQVVDEWLTTHGIEHVIEPRLPWNMRRRADFLARNHYIEVWGVVGNAKYEAKRTEKIVEYRAHDCKLVELYPRQIWQGDFSALEVLR